MASRQFPRAIATFDMCSIVLKVTDVDPCVAACRMYVVGKDMQSQRVYVAPAHGHPSLFTLSAALQDAHWIAGQPPQELQQGRGLACSFKAR